MVHGVRIILNESTSPLLNISAKVCFVYIFLLSFLGALRQFLLTPHEDSVNAVSLNVYSVLTKTKCIKQRR